MNLYENRCTEVAFRQSLSDGDFWERVFHGNDGPDDPMDDPEIYAIDLNTLAFVYSPCPTCGVTGPCAFDADDQPLFHSREEPE